MCDTGNRAEVTPAEALPTSLEWKGEVLRLEPVDELSVLTVCDNTVDILLPDQGPAKRLPLAGMARQAPMLEAATLQPWGRLPPVSPGQVGPRQARQSVDRPAATASSTPTSKSCRVMPGSSYWMHQ